MLKKFMCHWQIIKANMHLEMFSTLVKTKSNILNIVFILQIYVVRDVCLFYILILLPQQEENVFKYD